MQAIIKLDVPDWQINQDVTVYFPDTMMKRGKCEASTKDKVYDDIQDDWERLKKELKNLKGKPPRCKTCIYHREDGWCNENGRETKETDYCSFGDWEE